MIGCFLNNKSGGKITLYYMLSHCKIPGHTKLNIQGHPSFVQIEN